MRDCCAAPIGLNLSALLCSRCVCDLSHAALFKQQQRAAIKVPLSFSLLQCSVQYSDPPEPRQEWQSKRFQSTGGSVGAQQGMAAGCLPSYCMLPLRSSLLLYSYWLPIRTAFAGRVVCGLMIKPLLLLRALYAYCLATWGDLGALFISSREILQKFLNIKYRLKN